MKKRAVMNGLGVLLVFSMIFPLVGCGISTPKSQGPGDVEEVISEQERASADDVSGEDLAALSDGNLAFALDLYHQVEEKEKNLFYSPYSISVALGMTYAGARGETAEQMADTLHFDLAPEKLHAAFNALEQILSSRGEEELPEDGGDPFQLNIANALWGQKDYHFEEAFLDTIARYYGGGMRLVNFLEKAEEARQTINQWVYEKTEGKIEDLIPKGGVGAGTRLVLTNAIYFNASWLEKFPEERTEDGEFFTLDGGTITVPMMSYANPQRFRYQDGDMYQAVELPYVGNKVSMLVLVPDQGAFEEFEAGLNVETLSGIIQSMESQAVDLTFPKFEFETELSLAEVLVDMGMPAAMSPEADFSGMTGSKELFISDVFHKAFVSVDEEGTEAAAATAVVMTESAMPASPVKITVDRPFLFLIRDNETGAVLFLGRVLNPVE